MPTPLETYFSQFAPEFQYNPTAAATSEFYRLSDLKRWPSNRKQPSHRFRDICRAQFQDAIVKQFNEGFGTDENDLANWQALCMTMKLDPIPEDLEEARFKVKSVFVNLVDLVSAIKGRGGGSTVVRMFRTEQELSMYTKQSGKFFPRENAYAGGLLKHLLRNILSPGSSRT